MASPLLPRRPRAPRKPRPSLIARIRKNFLTGIVVIAPLFLTFWLVSSFVELIDAQAAYLIPPIFNPQSYIDLPGIGLLVFVVLTALLGALAKNLVLAEAIRWGEGVLDRLPVVRSIYNGIKQIAQTVVSQSQSSFERACLVEYPRKGVWSIAFISTETRGEVRERTGGEEMVSLFLPTTPNPTSGYLLFVPKRDVVELDMTVEEAAKLIISAGLVSPAPRPAGPPRVPQPGAARPASPPSPPSPLPAE